MSREGAPRRGRGRDIQLKNIMHPAVTVSPDATEREALEVLLENNVPGVPVVENDGTLVGFVTDGHLLGSALPKYMSTMEDVSFISEGGDAWVHYFTESADRPVSEVMMEKVSQIDVGKSEIVAAHKMVHDGVSSVVVTEGGRVVGIVNRLDLYAAILGLDNV